MVIKMKTCNTVNKFVHFKNAKINMNQMIQPWGSIVACKLDST